jgi:hypothetical protein
MELNAIFSELSEIMATAAYAAAKNVSEVCYGKSCFTIGI